MSGGRIILNNILYPRVVLQFAKVLASQSIPSWNQIMAWLKEMEILRRAVAGDNEEGFPSG
jgi:hypothetical protein